MQLIEHKPFCSFCLQNQISINDPSYKTVKNLHWGTCGDPNFTICAYDGFSQHADKFSKETWSNRSLGPKTSRKFDF